MGLDYGYDEVKGKWYARGFLFLKLYETREEMEADKGNALDEYFTRRKAYHDIAMAFTTLRYVR